ncbi:NADPH-dependent oxidoreductase [bacterium]|nr:MAG: NADPH-dependent oxidoreductase [bacterium]
MQSETEKQPRIVALCGSLGSDSATRRACELALEIAREEGAITELIDLRTWKLPFAASGFDKDEWPDVERLNTLIRSSDGLIWATPEYHGSYSGSFKNALDLGSFPEYKGRAVALLGVAGGAIGATQSLSHLRGVARTLHTICINEQVSIANSSSAFDAEGQFNDPKLAAGLRHMAVQLVRWSKIARTLRQELA